MTPQPPLPFFLCGQRVACASLLHDGCVRLFFGPQMTIQTCQGVFHDVSQWVLTLSPPFQGDTDQDRDVSRWQGRALVSIAIQDGRLTWRFTEGVCLIQPAAFSAPLPFSLEQHDPQGTNVAAVSPAERKDG